MGSDRYGSERSRRDRLEAQYRSNIHQQQSRFTWTLGPHGAVRRASARRDASRPQKAQPSIDCALRTRSIAARGSISDWPQAACLWLDERALNPLVDSSPAHDAMDGTAGTAIGIDDVSVLVRRPQRVESDDHGRTVETLGCRAVHPAREEHTRCMHGDHDHAESWIAGPSHTGQHQAIEVESLLRPVHRQPLKDQL